MDSLTLSFALVAGAVAAFNPCGFALLPAYLTVLVLDDGVEGPRTTASALGRATRFSVGMTVGFVVVFGAFGLVLTPLKVSIERYLPIVTLVIGAVLVVVGVMALFGRNLAIRGFQGRGAGPTRAWVSQVKYGVTFALASLSCTIGPFLAVTSGSLAGAGAIEVVVSFVVYALGMGIVVFALALVVVLASTTAVARIRGAVPVIAKLSGVLLVLAGAYVIWYGWFELRVLNGDLVEDPVITAALEVQTWLTRTVADLGASILLAVLGLLVVASLTIAGATRSRRRTEGSTGV